jgi:hypothetical protein
MTTGQTIEAKITVDATKAIAELAKFDAETKAAEKALRDADAATKAFERSQRDAVAAVTAIDTKIAKYERDMMALGNAILSGKGNTAAYEQELRQLGRELDALTGKTTAATVKTKDFARAASQVESSGRGGGLAMLEFSRAFEDAQYGITGVLNNIPSLLMALGVGGGLTGVVSVAAVGVSQLVKRFGEMPGEAQAGADVAKERLKSLSEELVRINREIRVMAIGEYQADLEAARPEIEAEIRRISDMIQSIGGRAAFEGALFRTRGGTQMEGLNAGLLGRFGMSAGQRALAPEIDPKVFQEIIAAREALQKRLSVIDAQARREEAAREKETLDAIQRANEEELRLQEELAKNRAEKTKEARKKLADMERQAEIDAWKTKTEINKAERQAALAKIKEDRELAAMRADAIFKAEEDRAKESARRLKEIADQRRREEEEARRAEEAARQAELRDQEQKFTALATGMATAVGRFAAESAMGQEEALANLLSAAAAQAGGMITLEGGKILAAGIAGALVGNPAAPGQIVGGAALVAAGTAVQTGGPAAVQSLLGMAGMGAGKASGGDSGAARDRGAAPRSPRGGGGDGPLVINVSYGVGGPLPEDTAREIAKVMKTGNRRRGAA